MLWDSGEHHWRQATDVGDLDPIVHPKKSHLTIAKHRDGGRLKECDHCALFSVRERPPGPIMVDPAQPRPPDPERHARSMKVSDAEASQITRPANNFLGDLATATNNGFGASPNEHPTQLVNAFSCPRREAKRNGRVH